MPTAPLHSREHSSTALDGTCTITVQCIEQSPASIQARLIVVVDTIHSLHSKHASAVRFAIDTTSSETPHTALSA